MYDDLYVDHVVAEAKARVRKSKRRARASFSGEKRAAADEAIYNNFFSSDFAEKYESFFVYNSVNSEADTRRIIKRLVELDKKVYLPRVIGKNMEAVPLGDKFIRSPFGIEEPVGNAYTGNIDVAIIPAFAFDLYGNRIGYGGGYYDRFLENRNIYKVICAYDFQLTRGIPQEKHDVAADYILTDKRSRPVIEANGLECLSNLGADELKEVIGSILKDNKKAKETENETEDN